MHVAEINAVSAVEIWDMLRQKMFYSVFLIGAIPAFLRYPLKVWTPRELLPDLLLLIMFNAYNAHFNMTR